MGQTQSYAASPEDASRTTASPPESEPSLPPTQSSSSSPPSMADLIAEAMSSGEVDEEESLDAKAQRALECPCVADLRKGPCGVQFSEAFVCFIKSTAEEKGSDCVNPFVALQKCIKENPNAFSKDILEEEENIKEEEEVPDYKIIPPSWSKETKSTN